MSSRWRWILPVAVLGGGLALTLLLLATPPEVERRPAEARVPLVRVVTVETGRVPLHVTTHGTVTPRTESELVPEISGPVTWVSPALVPGGFFEQGEPLLRIDPIDFELAREQARADLARATSEAERARKELGRQRTLAERNVASAARLDDAENAGRIAEAAVRQARASLAVAERNLERSEIHAPYDGRVREEHVDVGQFVSRGAPIATLYAVDYAEVRLPVADEELAYVDLPLSFRDRVPDGQSGARVRLRAAFAGRDHVWEGRVVRTEGEIDPRSRMVHVVARVEDPYGISVEGRPPLKVGLFVEAEIEGRVLENAAVLPREALREGNRVLVVDDEGRLHFRPVEVARVSRDRFVVSGGLADGERVCISQLPAVVEGMQVRPLAGGDGAATPASGAEGEGAAS